MQQFAMRTTRDCRIVNAPHHLCRRLCRRRGTKQPDACRRQRLADVQPRLRRHAASRRSPTSTPDNVGKLAQAWSVQLTQPAGRRGGGPPPARGGAPQGRGGGRPRPRPAARRRAGEEGEAAGSNPEVTPIVVNGVMYLPARGNQVLALDGDTGKEIWRYQMPPTRHDHRARRGVLARRSGHPAAHPPDRRDRGSSRSTRQPASRRRDSAATAWSRSWCRGTACR